MTASSGEMLKASKLVDDEEGPGDEEEELCASGAGEEASGVDWIVEREEKREEER